MTYEMLIWNIKNLPDSPVKEKWLIYFEAVNPKIYLEDNALDFQWRNIKEEANAK